MDWKIAWITFWTIFLSELGDKTQLATILFATQSQSPWSIGLGASLALILSTILAVIVGQSLNQWLNPKLLNILAAIIFILIGIWRLRETLA